MIGAIRAGITLCKAGMAPLVKVTTKLTAPLSRSIAEKGLFGKVGSKVITWMGKHPYQVGLLGLSVWKPWEKKEGMPQLQPGMPGSMPMAGQVPGPTASAANPSGMPAVDPSFQSPGDIIAQVGAGQAVSPEQVQSQVPQAMPAFTAGQMQSFQG